MICKCSDCGRSMSTIIEYKKKKENIPKKWRWDGKICYDCLMKVVRKDE